MEVYLDNAATSRKKPDIVLKSIIEFLEKDNANPGRGGYSLSLNAGRKILTARDEMTEFFGGENAENLVYCQNVTMALNIAIKGLVRKGDHILISALEHNAVYRPVTALQEKGIIDFDVIPADRQGVTDLEAMEKLIRPETRLIVFSHASNICGTIFPLEEACKIAKSKGIYTIADTAQTAGTLPLNQKEMGIDVLAFTGHKHLLGPTGIGGMVMTDEMAREMQPLLEGGTGSASDSARQPSFMPDKFESGTINTVGIMGLLGGITYLKEQGLENERKKEMFLGNKLIQGLSEIKGVTIYGPKDMQKQTGTIAFNIEEVDNGELCYHLDKEYGIMGRPGLHCSPLGHKTLGTFPEGVMRLSVGIFTTEDEIDYTVKAIREITGKI